MVLRIVVLPELSSPIMIILIYFLLQSLLKTLPKKLPIFYVFGDFDFFMFLDYLN